MRVLTLDAALDGCSAGLVVDGVVQAERTAPGGPGQSAILPSLVESVLLDGARRLDRIAVTVGPGSFTGIRAALSLAHGISLAADIELRGVTIGAVLLAQLARRGGGIVWAAVPARRGRVFIECDGQVAAHDLAGLPRSTEYVTVCGPAAQDTVARLRGAGCEAGAADAGRPAALGIERAAAARFRPALPLYVDAARTTQSS